MRLALLIGNDIGTDTTLQTQAYYDYVERQYLLTSDMLEVVDFETQLNSTVGRHEFVVGAGVRWTSR